MLRRQLAGLIVATLTVSTLFCALSLGIAGPQEKTKEPAPGGRSRQGEGEGRPARSPGREAAETRGADHQDVAEYDLKPHPLPPIPDDPPPHEGAMISLPHVVEPPDLILIEVLDALPGRPISGERLVTTRWQNLDSAFTERSTSGG